MTVDDVTIRGREWMTAILSFKDQEAYGRCFTSPALMSWWKIPAIEDTKGNRLKSLKANNIVLRRVRG
ncbi:MAG: hypothetical protein R3C56_36085 [Pirellulaceae bacterium]